MKYLILLTLALLIAACSPTNVGGVAAITAIPQTELTAAAALPTSSPPPTAASTEIAAEPTSALSALVAQAGSATPTPLDNDLPFGSAREIAAATDVAMQTTPGTPQTFDTFPVALTFDEFYDAYDIRAGLSLSDKLLSLDGKEIVMEGYMAPPLKPQLDYFVLTRIRLAFCPFCSTAADWPDDIALVYMNDNTTTATEYPVRITGRIEVGASVDQETGMVSLVRVYADALEILN